MANNLSNGTNFQVRNAAGTVVWEGNGIVNSSFYVTNSKTTSATAWYPGTPIIAAAALTAGAPYALSTADPVDFEVVGAAVASASSVGYLGVACSQVAATPATAPPGYVYPAGLVAGQGSIMPVNMVSATGALGAAVGGSATAGLGGVVLPSTTNLAFGTIVKAGADLGATAGVDGAGGAGRFRAIVLVHNW